MVPSRSHNVNSRTALLMLMAITAVTRADDTGGSSSSNTPNKLDDYVLTTQSECYKSKRLFSCFKYRFSRYVWSFASGRMNWFVSEDHPYEGGNGLQLVRLNEPQEDDVFPEARQILPYDNEMLRAGKFLQRSLNTFIAVHGVRIGMGAESGARLLSDSEDFETRGKKKKNKWGLILPLALLLKLVHMKLLLKPILLGVGLIQILLILGGLIIFHYFRNSSICRIQPHVIHSHAHIATESSPEISYAGYGAYPSYSASPYNAYSKDWAANRAYSGYNFVDAMESQKI
ncbi:uncharacterized protein LOC129762712 [Toxorhynchites rutilus septentrionalis]|uniref:uncharacterized protein LOC129762712 n=1 Tax=Toxorhynchites rutilus septentrionalis TaxID=329112 RepID=UPI0024795141|nr:uncharacterized protein LOC129762712 [Toxorhynchites rutilus septentrionalis]